MDAHDELFYRLNDPDPHTQVMPELDLLRLPLDPHHPPRDVTGAPIVSFLSRPG